MWAALLTAFLGLWTGHASAQGFSRLEWKRADAHKQTPAEVMDVADGWQTFDGTLTLGFQPGSVWLRAWPIRDAAALTEPHFIRVGMAFLDDVRMFHRDASGSWIEEALGDTHSGAGHRIQDRLFLFAAPTTENGPVLIRVSSTSSLSIGLEHLDLMTLHQRRNVEFGLLGCFVTLCMVALVWSLLQALVHRDSVSGWFAAYQACSLLMGLALSGYGSFLLPAQSSFRDALTSVLVLMATAPAMRFHRGIAAEIGVHRLMLLIMDAVTMLVALTLLLLMLGQPRLALSLNAAMVTTVTVLFLGFLAARAWSHPTREVRLTLLTYALLGVFILVSMLPVLGWGHLGLFSLYATVLHGVLSAVMLGILLFNRNARLVRELGVLQEKTMASDRATRQAKAERDDRDQLLSMLMHELRTPLSVLRMVIDSAVSSIRDDSGRRLAEHGRRAVQDLNDVIERTLQVDRLEQGYIELRPARCRLAEVIDVACREQVQQQRVQIELQPDLPLIHSDPILLKIVLGNLLDNALKYSPEHSNIHLAVSRCSRDARMGVIFQVRNLAGRAGRPDRDRVFQKYYRSEGAHRSTGSGLGLFLIHGLAVALGGEVRFRDDVPGEKICFEFWVPE